MKVTKVIVLATLVAGSLMAGSTLMAQDATSTNAPAARAGRGGAPNIDKIATDLNLTAEQKTKFKAAMDDQMKKMVELRNDSSLSQEDRRAKMQEIRKATDTKVKEILTADQYAKWQKMQPAGGRRGPGGARQSGN